jgi:hypothetical protein
MAIQFVPGQVAVGDPSPGGPSAASNVKNKICKVVKLSSANFTTGGANNLVAVLPADATILGFDVWVRTQLTGGSISAATMAIGSASGGAQFHAASALAFGTAGAFTVMPTPLGIFQNYNIPNGPDIQVWVSGVASTGNPTGGELYLVIHYAR